MLGSQLAQHTSKPVAGMLGSVERSGVNLEQNGPTKLGPLFVPLQMKI